MATMNIVLPAMGEGVIEATINKWLVAEGAMVSEDDPLVDVATDKVDSEVPSPSDGRIVSIIAREGSVVKVGEIIAVMENDALANPDEEKKVLMEVERVRETINEEKNQIREAETASREMKSRTPSGKFLSPLVRSIASRENIAYSDLDKISGTGMDGRITRDDVMNFLSEKVKEAEKAKEKERKISEEEHTEGPASAAREKINLQNGDVVVEMDRVRRLIADHMVQSKKISPHVTSFIDADVTRLVNWRNSVKDKFLAAEGQKLTLTPVFIDATARALYEFPMLNISVDGNNIIIKKNINIGMATALPDGNLIVPVIKNANEKSLTGIAKNVNDLADRARKNKLKPDEITGGTFTVTNFGSYNNLSGTPIINQPQAAILGTGVVRKMPAVVETPDGDMIAIRHIMILSLSYDHRVIDGALAGKFLNRIKEILENYSPDNF
ncbi:MAG TPA: dihydrolipoamide acetyltransferase family protein [Bacteroidales bacterium]|nr:dihydrolipoamide acetyltransferase family protein [Bacteroidales bacterium]HPF02737.1 dihydrolipoamide acetyltransferase family protein [Bacteroidales bacterium]HPJ59149.1 dihydrolipoamide acetyltransferase family protein [Bacteroidales bacterium]HPR12761.1 dihydrolipoamide acetyltransferase family protein [Bacteroidales bacterium]HRW84365.1 dihydrolipoamide acetyltransferase family protein [Bacteroidales bacterium]